MIFVVIYTVIEFINFMLAYYVVFHVEFKKNKLSYVLLALLLFTIQIFVLEYLDSKAYDVVTLIAGFSIPLLLVNRILIKNVFIFPIIYIGTSLINVVGSYLIATLFGITQMQLLTSSSLIIASEMTCIMVLLSIYYIKKRNKILWESKIGGIQYVFLLGGLLALALVIGCIQCYEELRYIPTNLVCVLVIAIFSVFLLFFVLFAWHAITLRKEMEEREKKEEYASLIRIQQEYMYMIAERDENIRKFRHDLKAHVIALLAHAKENKDNVLENYVRKIGDYSEVESIYKYTGNTMMDGLLSELIERAKRKEIDIVCEIQFAVEDKWNIFDLCIIFFNLLMNAIEACEKIENKKNRKIVVRVIQDDKRIYIYIKNTFDEKNLLIKNKKIISTKEDKVNHGIGIKNVNKVIEYYYGTIENISDDGWYTVKVTV
ncbi:sensor histidine kinase [Anaerosporobacter sp.]|uniref:sensor histidine kinase n=1 Tax=Anaerosporobacter sp. TaxID=1872529 RepID=UPI00286EFD68|nr:ATP-binding protein [Anaerosporobacter sp.]